MVGTGQGKSELPNICSEAIEPTELQLNQCGEWVTRAFQDRNGENCHRGEMHEKVHGKEVLLVPLILHLSR